MEYLVSVVLGLNIFVSIHLLQVSNVNCFFPSFVPTTLISLDIPHNNGPTNVSIQTIDKDSIDLSNAGSTPRPNKNKDPNKGKCPQCVCGTVNRKMRIVGGVPTEQHEFPWMVALSRKGKFYCAATIITKEHLLTAAHCVEGFTSKEIKASLGEYNRALKNETSKTSVRIEEIVRHPEFQISNFKNDIAILKMDTEISFDTPHIQPACLPTSENRNYTGLKAVVTGWGRTGETKPTSNEMRKVEVPILSVEECRKRSGYVPSRITKDMMCAGYNHGQKDSCQGDSGGPLQIQGDRPGTMEVIGIVSWGRGCARPFFPGVYTRIENFMSWINNNIDNRCTCRE